MAKEHTLKELFEIIDPLLESGQFDLRYGTYEGEDFLVVGSWDEVAHITGLINGFEGLKNHFGPYNGETLADERTKVEAQLAKELQDNPNHLGTHSRLRREIEAINSVILYKQHLHTQGIEDPKSIDDYVDWGFNDEYDTCCGCSHGCNNIVRTSPDSYSWTPPLFVDCEGYACTECVEAGHYDDYVLDAYKNEQKSIPDDFDLNRLGLEQVNEETLENGLYGGQLDTPVPIIEAMNDAGIDVWFKVYPGQFDLSFDVYVKAEDLEKAKEVFNRTDTKADEDPAVVCERGLRAASKAMAELPDGQGIKYARINGDGTADVRLVSNEEFVDGIKDK